MTDLASHDHVFLGRGTKRTKAALKGILNDVKDPLALSVRLASAPTLN
jgi:hypothetical protein